jgi:hypothetical protein
MNLYMQSPPTFAIEASAVQELRAQSQCIFNVKLQAIVSHVNSILPLQYRSNDVSLIDQLIRHLDTLLHSVAHPLRLQLALSFLHAVARKICVVSSVAN